MNAPLCQRWRDRRDSYRPAGEPIRTREYEVAAIPDDRTARAFVEAHHYSRSYPAALGRFGLYRRGGELVGVLVLSTPASEAVLQKALPFFDRDARAQLGRLVLLDDVPSNAESWFVSRCFELARDEGYEAIASDSDDFALTTPYGNVVFPGHVGTVYQALNARYVGRANPNTIKVFPDGTKLNARVLSKLRRRECGWRYGVELLEQHGAAPPEGEWLAWVKYAVALTTRTYRHPGCHRYLFGLDRRARRHLPESLPYPKLIARAAAIAIDTARAA